MYKRIKVGVTFSLIDCLSYSTANRPIKMIIGGMITSSSRPNEYPFTQYLGHPPSISDHTSTIAALQTEKPQVVPPTQTDQYPP
jgi:hypothetical protein